MVSESRRLLQKAGKRDYQFVWIDICCIDKSNKEELSKSIRSMYTWYQSADACLVYLEDTRKSTDFELFNNPRRFRGQKPKWFTRGWTLQELLAP
jgi:Heterokaryon incompatibility protein (HET)